MFRLLTLSVNSDRAGKVLRSPLEPRCASVEEFPPAHCSQTPKSRSLTVEFVEQQGSRLVAVGESPTLTLRLRQIRYVRSPKPSAVVDAGTQQFAATEFADNCRKARICATTSMSIVARDLPELSLSRWPHTSLSPTLGSPANRTHSPSAERTAPGTS